MRAIQCTRFGGPDVLELVDVSEPAPGDGEVLVEVSAAGVNYADTSRIAGTYTPTPALPFVPGTEVVGRTPDGRVAWSHMSEDAGDNAEPEEILAAARSAL